MKKDDIICDLGLLVVLLIIGGVKPIIFILWFIVCITLKRKT